MQVHTVQSNHPLLRSVGLQLPRVAWDLSNHLNKIIHTMLCHKETPYIMSYAHFYLATPTQNKQLLLELTRALVARR